MGLSSDKKKQLKAIDDDLRNGLWNALTSFHWIRLDRREAEKIIARLTVRNDPFIMRIWSDFFKKTLDSLGYWDDARESISEFFYSGKWNDVYDFIEFVANATENKPFVDECNRILEREVSSYRFVGWQITPITSEEEIAEIDEALKGPLAPVTNHIRKAVDRFSDRKEPDYQNSIKEAISGVESACNIILKSKKASFGSAIDELSKKIDIHPALKRGFSSIYGYTSTADGIRHAMIEKSNLQ